MKRVIFVGIHNKPGLEPLCTSTKSGKLIEKVAVRVGCECIKTNLYDTDTMPEDPLDKLRHSTGWGPRIKPKKDDIIILLGREVRDNFDWNLGLHNVLAFPHPASVRSTEQMKRYVQGMAGIINAKL